MNKNLEKLFEEVLKESEREGKALREYDNSIDEYLDSIRLEESQDEEDYDVDEFELD